MTDRDPQLFDDVEPELVPVGPEAKLRTRGGMEARRTAARLAKMADGYHATAGLRLHPEAAPYDQRNAPGRRCGNCAFLWIKKASGFEGPKCEKQRRNWLNDGPDIRHWWPACTAHKREEERG